MESGKLRVEKVCLDYSNSVGKYHAGVLLDQSLSPLEALTWQIHLGSDLYRGRADLMRAARGIEPCSLLIRKYPFRGFWRKADAICPCQEKHETEEQFKLGAGACEIWKQYRGLSPWELFGPPCQSQESPVRLPLGRVPLELIEKRKYGPVELNPIKTGNKDEESI